LNQSPQNKNNKLFNPNFLLFWKGQIVSSVGSQIYYMAMILWITEATDSASLLGLMGMVAGIPTIVLSTIGGTVADRYSRKKIMLIGDVVNAVVVLILAYLFYTSSSSISMLVAFVMGISFISSIVASFFIPAASAALPDLVPEDKLTAANSFRQSAFQVATIAGWTLSSFLYVYLGIFVLILFNGVTFIVGAVTKYFVTIPQVKLSERPEYKESKFLNELKEGLKYVWNRKGLRKIVLASIFINFFAIPVAILLPFYVKDHLSIGSHWLPIFMSCSMGGSMLGLLLAGILKLDSSKKSIAIVTAMMINGCLIFVLGFNQYTVGAIAILVFSGASTGFIQVHIQTIMQLSTAQEIRGRVFGFISTITGALTPLGMGLSGFVGDLTNKNFALIYGVSGLILICVTLFVITSKDISKFLSFDSTEISDESNLNDSTGINGHSENELLTDEKIDQYVTQFKKIRKT